MKIQGILVKNQDKNHQVGLGLRCVCDLVGDMIPNLISNHEFSSTEYSLANGDSASLEQDEHKIPRTPNRTEYSRPWKPDFHSYKSRYENRALNGRVTT